MFSLSHQKAKLTSVNPRAEIHGQDIHLIEPGPESLKQAFGEAA